VEEPRHAQATRHRAQPRGASPVAQPAAPRCHHRARILLASDGGADLASPTDGAVASAVGVDARTVARVRAEFARDGLERALCGRPRVFPPRRMLSSAQEAHLVTLACSTPPPGHTQWTLRLLATRLVELEVIPAISHETVRHALKKTISNPGACGGG